MKIIIEINEVRPGELRTTINGLGVASPLENKMVDHVCGALDGVIKSFAAVQGGAVQGRMETKTFKMPKG